MEGCTFCKLYNVQGEPIYENKLFWARLDKFPMVPGHTEIIPKRHVVSLTDLTKEESDLIVPSIKSTIRRLNNDLYLRAEYEAVLENPINEASTRLIEEVLRLPYLGQKIEDYNVGINNGVAAGRTINHLHIHIIPRFLGDVEDYVGGIRHMIPGKGNYKK